MGENLGGHTPEHRDILLVEDHAATAEMISLFLEDEGYHIRWVDTAHGAIEYFSQLPTDNHDMCPDLVLMDLSLPDMDSVQMVEQVVRAHKSMPPVVLVSAKPAYLVQQAAQLIGATGTVRKPFEIDVLLDAVRHAIEPPTETITR
jgi:two-component system response regulator RpaA